MSRRDHYAPKHRSAPAEPALKKRLGRSMLLSGVAVVATGVAVSAGVFVKDEAPDDSAVSAIEAAVAARQGKSVSVELIRERESEVSGETSRSDRRTSLDPAHNDQPVDGQLNEDPREIARAMLSDFGFSSSEFSCLDALYVSESGWKVDADNPTSSAYGIPQALTEMHDLPADYMTNPTSQIRWGMGYIRDSYGTPCAAWEFKQANDFY